MGRLDYEGEGGWADGRLGQAYDLISSIRSEWPTESDTHDKLRAIMSEIENADIAIGNLA